MWREDSHTSPLCCEQDQYLTFDFGKPVELAQFRMKVGEGDGCPRCCELQISDQGFDAISTHFNANLR